MTIRTGGSDTTTPKGSFNLDTLTGGAGSKFTRNSVPEAIDLTNQNVFRVRFGWLGSAPIVFEVFSPDGVWVAFHVIRMPNSQSTPSICNPNLPITLWMSDTGTGLTMGSSCWAAGSSSPDNRLSEALSARTVARQVKSVNYGKTAAGAYVNHAVDVNGGVFLTDAPAAIAAGPVTTVSTTLFTTDTTGYNTYAVQLDGTWVGPIIFETSNDNTNWVPAWGWSNSNDVVPVDRVFEEDLITLPVTGRYLRARTDPTFVGSVTWVNYLRQQATEGTGTLSVAFDSAQTFPISGRSPSGATQQINVDAYGNLKVSDCAGPFSYIGTTGTSGTPFGAVIDTTGYATVIVHQISSGLGLNAYFSNDGINWFAAVGAVPGTAGTAAITNAMGTSSNVYGVFPAIGRYFRFISAGGGAQNLLVYLKSQAVNPLQAITATNISQANGFTIPSAQPANSGGNITGLSVSGGAQSIPALPGVNTTIPASGIPQAIPALNNAYVAANQVPYPVGVAGTDVGGYMRRILTDNTGAQVVVGPNPALSTSFPLNVRVDQGTNAADGIIDALNNIVREIREMKMYLKELPLYLNSGINVMDERDSFRDDPTNFSN